MTNSYITFLWQGKAIGTAVPAFEPPDYPRAIGTSALPKHPLHPSLPRIATAIGVFNRLQWLKTTGTFLMRHFIQSAILKFAAALAVASCVLMARGDDFVNPKAIVPPVAKQGRIAGGESMPPLPLPATPLPPHRAQKEARRARRWLAKSISTSSINRGLLFPAYPSVTIDIENLMNWTNNQLQLRYRYVETDLTKFSFSPTELPVLYITGWTPLPEFSDRMKQNLREYLMAGGTLIVHANCGRPEFNDSFIKLQGELFPDRPMGWLPPDHPIYSCLHKIETMKFREGDGPWKQADLRQPGTHGFLMGMNIGCRAAIIYSPIDISWGWDANAKPIPGGILYDQTDSLKLGSNMLTYVLANYEYARAFEINKIYHQADAATRDQLVVAQVMHAGDWDPTPHGLPNLLKFIDTNSTLNVQFKRTTVSLDDVDVLKHPLLYMTGLREFKLNEKELKRLSDYLKAGGVLFGESAMGSEQFDANFRKMVEAALPDGKLEQLPLDHPIFNNVFKEQSTKYTPLVTAIRPDAKSPVLEAVVKDGVPVVIYSRFSLSNGWEELPNPYVKGYDDTDALKLGTNILVYSLTH